MCEHDCYGTLIAEIEQSNRNISETQRRIYEGAIERAKRYLDEHPSEATVTAEVPAIANRRPIYLPSERFIYWETKTIRRGGLPHSPAWKAPRILRDGTIIEGGEDANV